MLLFILRRQHDARCLSGCLLRLLSQSNVDTGVSLVLDRSCRLAGADD